MNKTIWKFELDPAKTEVRMPIGAEILSIQTQYKTPVLWALVNPNDDTEIRHIEIFGTGHEIPCDMGVGRKYISTFQMYDGSLVFHAFERLN